MSLPPIAVENAFVAVVDQAQSYHELLQDLEKELKKVLRFSIACDHPLRLEVDDFPRGPTLATRLHGMGTCCPVLPLAQL